MTARLAVTDARLAMLAAANTLPWILVDDQAELAVAGWIHAADDGTWQPTPYGHALLAVRVLEREDGRHLVAETGDSDEPRVLGDALKSPHAYRVWFICVNGVYASALTEQQARDELWHMAASLLAAEDGAA